MMEATHTKGSAMIITHGRNEIKHDAEAIKPEGRKIPKEEQFCNYCKKLAIQRRYVGNCKEDHYKKTT